jgi:hypothetical protein
VLTVACVLVNGNVPYTPQYVERLQSMVERGLRGTKHRFVCLTDQPDAMPHGVEPIKIALPPGLFGWWAKIELFNPRHNFQGRMLYIDLDSLVVGDLNLISDYPSWFAIVPDAAKFTPSNGLRVVKAYNSSVMVWTAGIADDIYTSWSPAVSTIFWGDQDWIGALRPRLARMPLEWFPRLSQIRWPEIPKSAVVVLIKKPKPHIAARQLDGFEQMWG